MHATEPSTPKQLNWRDLSVMNRVVLIWFLLDVAMFFWVTFGAQDFFESAACFHLLLLPTVGASVALTFGFYSVMPFFSAQLDQYTKRIHGMNHLGKYVLMPIVVAIFFGYIPLAWGFPNLLHKMLANPYSSTFTVEMKELERSRRSHCNKISIKELNDHWFGKLCVSQRDFSELALGDSITLNGTMSWFGFEVNGYSYQSKQPLKPVPQELDVIKSQNQI